jgi:outer membrane protein
MRQQLRSAISGLIVVGAMTTVAAQTPSVVLTLKEAERMATAQHPLIRASQYAALAADESVRETRAAYFPTALGSFTGAGALDGTRIAAGGLNNPIILDRFAAGVGVSQLVTDFGRTSDLVASARYVAEAREKDVDVRRADVLLQVDRAYFDVLREQAVLKVAQQAVDARKLIVDQIEALAQSQLKSGLDVSFARVNLSEAQLLLVQARNDLDASFAGLSAATGSTQRTKYELVDEALPAAPEDDGNALVARALRERPDVSAQRLADQASAKFAEAERSLALPSISFVGAAGFTPYHQIGLTDRYSAAGVNVIVPLSNGNLFAARRAEAAFRAQGQTQALHDLENRVARDVMVAWLDARTAFQRLDLTAELLVQASAALELATARYNLGLSSIVELTQAQLNHTRAEIEQATSQYQYQIKSATLRYQTGELR